LQNSKSIKNLSHLIKKLVFRSAILPHTKNSEKIYDRRGKKIEAQIKEYAANLPLVIDIDQLTVEFLRENFTNIQHWHWFIIIVVLLIQERQYGMMN
jgi:hypothetical protein